MYSEAKLAFYIYLWYPKTMVKFIIQVFWGKYTDFKCIQIMFILFFFRLFQGTYVYDSFFKPYISKHEPENDRNLMELKTRLFSRKT
ncbi:hypothetical protein Hanom_Chr16g01516481 [Helianthus anomalus]